MKQWEYKIISMANMVDTYAPYDKRIYSDEVSKYSDETRSANLYPYQGRVLVALNKLGQLGWEYIEHSPEGHSHGVFTIDNYVFKREKQ